MTLKVKKVLLKKLYVFAVKTTRIKNIFWAKNNCFSQLLLKCRNCHNFSNFRNSRRPTDQHNFVHIWSTDIRIRQSRFDWLNNTFKQILIQVFKLPAGQLKWHSVTEDEDKHKAHFNEEKKRNEKEQLGNNLSNQGYLQTPKTHSITKFSIQRL